ncbi:MAG: AmmeMemoRadiSam system protein A [Candidatus Cloacimonetes bacterium]|nr:AmmeMemoRadiSam system protein A [Candidatus Cloacimonadota bacterium]MDD2211339.1 AmmeMemoRadiSam system protein A [Candidatus Cloacimonadota bacterium]
MFSAKQRKDLLDFAAAVIKNRLDGSQYNIPQDDVFQVRRGIFVSLHKHGELRGCIGYIQPYKKIVDSVREMALAAAFRDPRFRPLTLKEFGDIQIEISILTELEPITDVERIEIGADGLYLEHPDGSGLLLPQVAVEWNWDRLEFLTHLCRKAGLADGAYKDSQAQLYRFGAEIFANANVLD